MLTGPPPKFHGTWDILTASADQAPVGQACRLDRQSISPLNPTAVSKVFGLLGGFNRSSQHRLDVASVGGR